MDFLPVGVQPMFLLYVVVMAVFAGIAVLVTVVRLASMRGQRQYWDRLGYSPAQSTAGNGLFRRATNHRRVIDGHEIAFQTRSQWGFISRKVYGWTHPLPTTPGFQLQLVEADIAPKRGKNKNMNKRRPYPHSFAGIFGRGARGFSWYNWKQHITQRIDSGDLELDARFAIYATDPQRAQRVFRDPHIRHGLLELPHVDLSLTETEIRLDDPYQSNVWGLNAAQVVGIHDHVAQLLIAIAEAAQISDR